MKKFISPITKNTSLTAGVFSYKKAPEKNQALVFLNLF